MHRFVSSFAFAATIASTAHAQDLRVYIAADMEGIAGLSAMDDPAGPRLMTEEVNAAVAGAFEAGASGVLVNDAHGSHANLLVERLGPRALLQRGNLKPYGMMEGLDDSYSVVLLIGVHAEASVTVAFLSGDSLAIEELRALVPTVHGVTVKRGIWGRAVHSLSPDSARALIRRGVRVALGDPGLPLPRAERYEVEMEYTSAIYAEIAEGIPGVDRSGPTTVRFTVREYPEAYRMIRVLYKHIGQ